MRTIMNQSAVVHAKPPLLIGDVDHRHLVSLAVTLEKRAPEVSAALLAELDRARIVPQHKVPEGTVRMGSTVRFTTNGTAERRVAIVVPGKADIDAGRISVMTPIGAALIGLSTGQSIHWRSRDGREQELEILAVEAPEEGAA